MQGAALLFYWKIYTRAVISINQQCPQSSKTLIVSSILKVSRPLRMQRVVKGTFNQSSLVDELMCEWAILPDAAAIWRVPSPPAPPPCFLKVREKAAAPCFVAGGRPRRTASSKRPGPRNLRLLFETFYAVFIRVSAH